MSSCRCDALADVDAAAVCDVAQRVDGLEQQRHVLLVLAHRPHDAEDALPRVQRNGCHVSQGVEIGAKAREGEVVRRLVR